jgi:hypothetical protein
VSSDSFVLGKLRQEDREFEDNLGNTARPCLKQPKRKRKKE